MTAASIETVGMTRRRRLSNRRLALTETIEFATGDGRVTRYEATVGFDELGRPKEVFLFRAKDGTDMAAVLADTAVALSVALQHGVLAQAMALVDQPRVACGRLTGGRHADLGRRRGA
jgi:hypothetical protein